MFPTSPELRGNRLLAALPLDVWKDLAPYLELVHLKFGQVLSFPQHKIFQIYFPTTAFLSVIATLREGDTIEGISVGREGHTCVEATPFTTVATVAGHAYRMTAGGYALMMDRSSVFRQLMCRYDRVLFTQVIHRLACTKHHTLHQKSCRWLLAAMDAVNSDEVVVTQQTLADVLGARREGLTEVHNKWVTDGVVEGRVRGCHRVLNRPALVQQSCSCYQLMRSEFISAFPQQYKEIEDGIPQPEVIDTPIPTLTN
jgi:hypothetical protein